eukprot:scaffold5315_cov63-Cylindrotheca_fusiformis.AAC.2
MEISRDWQTSGFNSILLERRPAKSLQQAFESTIQLLARTIMERTSAPRTAIACGNSCTCNKNEKSEKAKIHFQLRAWTSGNECCLLYYGYNPFIA